MNHVSPADNNVDLANTVKDMMARLTTIESHLEAQTKVNDKLQAENVELKAKQEEKDVKQEERNDKLESSVDELEVKNEEHTTMITIASDEIISLKAYIEELEAKTLTTSPSPPQPPPTLTNIPNPSATPPALPSTPTPPTSPPPTSLALPWRCAFLLVGSGAPGFYINYAIRGNRWYAIMGGVSVTTSAGAMILYYFASLDNHGHDDITNEGGQ